jgi:hypothetical protein
MELGFSVSWRLRAGGRAGGENGGVRRAGAPSMGSSGGRKVALTWKPGGRRRVEASGRVERPPLPPSPPDEAAQRRRRRAAGVGGRDSKRRRRGSGSGSGSGRGGAEGKGMQKISPRGEARCAKLQCWGRQKKLGRFRNENFGTEPARCRCRCLLTGRPVDVRLVVTFSIALQQCSVFFLFLLTGATWMCMVMQDY